MWWEGSNERAPNLPLPVRRERAGERVRFLALKKCTLSLTLSLSTGRGRRARYESVGALAVECRCSILSSADHRPRRVHAFPGSLLALFQPDRLPNLRSTKMDRHRQFP